MGSDPGVYSHKKCDFEHVILSLYKQSRLWLRRSVNSITPYNSLNLSVPKGVPMALKIVYKICCGIDVHKTFVVACKNFMGSDPNALHRNTWKTCH